MTRVAITPLQLPPGVVRGRTPAQSAGRWYDTNLVRWKSGILAPVGGWQRITSTPAGSTPRRLLPWLDNSADQYLAAACDEHLLIYTGDTVFDATPVDLVTPDSLIADTGYGTNTYGEWDYGEARPVSGSIGLTLTDRPYSFSLATFGEDLLFVSSADGRLLRYEPSAPAVKASAVSGAPISNRGVTVTPERHVILFGIDGYPRRFGWCSQEDIGDWDFVSTTNTAGFLDVDSEGVLVAAVQVKEGTLLFSEGDAWLARYVGTPFIYSVERVGYTDGPISPQAVATFQGRAVWMGRRGFWVYDAGFVRPLPCEVGEYVFDNMNLTYGRFRTCASDNGTYSEVWWWYPAATPDENDSYVIWNYEENWWAIGQMVRSAACPAGVYPYPIAADSDGHLYYHENGWTDAGSTRVPIVYATTGTMSLGERMTNILQLQADSGTGYAATLFKIYGGFTPDKDEDTITPFVFTPGATGYADGRCQLRELRLRVEQTQDSAWTIGRMYVHGSPGGRR
jgi:hypothetical protein